MILVDVNLLLYANNPIDPRHDAARDWWDEQLSGTSPVCLDWTILHGFIRISSNPRVFKDAPTVAQVVTRVNMWLDQPSVRVLSPTDQHWRVFRELLEHGQATSNLVADAHIAAIAIEHGCELQTTDADFSRFPNLKWRNPLKAVT